MNLKYDYKDNLSTKDKSSAPNVSVIRRFHCVCLNIHVYNYYSILHVHVQKRYVLIKYDNIIVSVSHSL